MAIISRIKNSFFKSDSIFYFVFFILFILPFFYISLFNFSGAADDLFFATYNTHLGYLDKIIYSYNNYIGRYFNAFFFSISPDIFMKVWFAKLHPIVDLLLLTFSIRYLVLISNLFQRDNIWKLTLIIIGLILLFIPQVNIIYWYSGSTVYIFPLSGLIWVYALFVKGYLKSLNLYERVVLCILIFAVCGSNEIFMVFVLYGSIVFCVFKMLGNKSKKYWSFLFLAVAAYSNYLVITSPGTTRRITGESFRYLENHLENVVASILPTTFNLMWDWLFIKGMIMIPILITLGVNFFKSPDLKISRKSYLLTISFILSLIIGGLFIYLYSFGTLGTVLPRVLNIYFILFLLSLIVTGLYLNQIFIDSILESNRKIIFWVGLVFLIFAKSENLKIVYSDLLEGKAKQMQEESIWRFKYLADMEEKNAVLPRLTIHPKTFMVPDWNSNSNSWTNKHLATFFNKESVSINQSLTVREYRGKAESLNGVNKFGGFEFYFEKETKSIIIENISGDKTVNFFMHYIPRDKEMLNNKGEEISFINNDFVFPKEKEILKIKLPKFELQELLIGQYKGANRIWTTPIYFTKEFYE
ncbi:MAG: hypothetical protein JKY48_16470 [Flavobacteriales bacterium]|nr:hypothetical protein [Flavobacteriales bacterium]